MQLLINFLDNFLDLLNAMSLYIIIGLFFAGILKQLIPDNFVSSHLGKDSTSSVVKATLFGIPLPVCSCSVIPLAQGLKKEGASKGAVQSFLISTPITGVDSILATYSLFGFVFTLYRVVSSVIIAITVGLVQNLFEKKDTNTTYKNIEKTESCCSSNSSSTSSCCSSSSNTTSSCCSSSSTKKGFSFIAVLKYGYGTLFNDMAKALIVGLFLGALFMTVVPKEYTQILFENQFLTYLVVMLFAMPLYTCATASLPFAAAFMIQGMSPGAVFIFLTVGPATSAVTMSVVYKMLGRTALIVYLLVIAVLGLLFGYIYDTFFKELSLLTIAINHEDVSIFSIFASIFMIALIIYHIFKDKFSKKTSCCSSDETIRSELKNTNNLKPNSVQNNLTLKGSFSQNKNSNFKVK